jgi:hypothetical protein
VKVIVIGVPVFAIGVAEATTLADAHCMTVARGSKVLKVNDSSGLEASWATSKAQSELALSLSGLVTPI